MKLFRDDLIISPAEENNKVTIKDLRNNEVYEFGEEEYFVINEIKTPYHERVLLAKFNAKFNDHAEITYINNLISMLDEWGLLEGNRETSTSPDNDKIGQKSQQVKHWSLFRPQKILDQIVLKFGFLRFLVPLVPFMFFIALSTLIINFHLFKEDLVKVHLKFNTIEHLIYTMFTINLMTALVKGSIARYYNIPAQSFGIMLVFGLIPRFVIPVKVSERLDRKTKLWIYSASILVRIILISFGIIVWFSTRHLGTSVSILGLALALYSMITLLLIANPFLGFDGYKFISTFFNSPNFRKKANKSLRYLFFKPPEAIAKYTDDSLSLKIYAALSLIFLISLITFVGFSFAQRLELDYQGFGVALFLILVIYISGRFILLFRKRNNLREVHLSNVSRQETTRNRDTSYLVTTKEAPVSFPIKNDIKSPKRNKAVNYLNYLKYFLLLIFLVILFLPYKYEPGGTAVVLPVLHQEIYFDKKGIIQNVYYDGGEWVDKGTIVAEMENYKQTADVDITRSKIQKKKEEINVLLTTPLKEEVDLAKQQVYAAKLQLKYSSEDFARIKKLYNKDVFSLSAYSDAKEKMDLDKQDFLLKKANLVLVQNQVNKHQLESAKIDLAILQRELELNEEELEKTKLRMPSDGKIITMNLQNLENKFLDDGQMFAEVEDSSYVQIEISIPEADASQLFVGNKIAFKPLLHPNKSIVGNITSIYPVTDSTTYGTVIKVTSVIPNDKFLLKTGMTGHAKVEGEEMLVFQAFSRAIVSFVLIEFWSWLP